MSEQTETKVFNRFRLLSGKITRWVGHPHTGHFESHRAKSDSDVMVNLTQNEINMLGDRIQPVGRYQFVDDGVPAPPQATGGPASVTENTPENAGSDTERVPPAPPLVASDATPDLRAVWTGKLRQSVADVVAEVATIDDIPTLEIIEELEANGKTRMTIIRAVTQRIDTLKDTQQ